MQDIKEEIIAAGLPEHIAIIMDGNGTLGGTKRLRPGIWTQTGGGYGEVGCRS